MKTRFITLVVSAIFLSACTSAVSPTPLRIIEEELGPPPAKIPLSATHVVSSEYFEEDFLIAVGLPFAYGVSYQETYPVLYMLDGNIEFGIGAPIAQLLNFNNEAPAVIVVGIGYDIDNIMEMVDLRTRDLSPTSTDMGGGNADNLIKFINEELKPFIAENYDANLESQILFGHSLAGLFATYTLFQDPTAFDSYIIGSPAYAWDDNVIFTFENNYAAGNSDMPARVFIGVGELEAGMSNTQKMFQRLTDRNYPGLDLEIYIYEDGTHFSTLGGTIGQGLLSVLSSP